MGRWLTREELHEVVWTEPLYRAGPALGIPVPRLVEACAQAHVPLPGRGHWGKVQFGKPVGRTPLPMRPPGVHSRIYVAPSRRDTSSADMETFLARCRSRHSPTTSSSSRRRSRARHHDCARPPFIGVRMGTVFGIAKEFIAMPVPEIEALLESPIHEARARACSVMGKAASHRKVTAEATRSCVRALPAASRPHQRLGPRGPRGAPGRRGGG